MLDDAQVALVADLGRRTIAAAEARVLLRAARRAGTDPSGWGPAGARTLREYARETRLAEAEMEILKIESTETLTREAAAARLHAIADGLASHNDVELDWGGKHVRLHVADEVRLELEIEVGEDATEFEIELRWSR